METQNQDSILFSAAIRKQLLLCFVVSFAFYSAVINFSQTTTNLTKNGLYKMREVKNYMTSHESENILPANLLYAPLIEAASYVLPHTELYLVAAYVNAFFAAVALCAWLLILRITGIAKWGLGLLLLYQALNGLFFWLAVSCEDITPSFACWLLSFALLLVWNRNKNSWLWLAVNILLHLSWLFHWTFLVAAVPVSVLCCFALVMKSTDKLKWIGSSLFVFLALCFCVALLAERNIFSLLYPAKAQGTLWVGWFSEKIVQALYYGFANQLFGRITLPGSGWQDWFSQPIAFWIPVLFAVFFLWAAVSTLKYFLNLRPTPEVQTLFFFGVMSFLLGQAVNAYEQGSDPQFLIQPMFTASVFFCGAFLYGRRLKLWYAGIISFTVLSLAFTALIVKLNWRVDETGLRHLEKTEKQFGTSTNWLCLIAGDDLISPWISYRYPNDSVNILFLPFDNSSLAELSPQQHYRYVETMIDRAEKSGKKIVTNGLPEADYVALGKKFTGYDLSQHLKYLQQQLSASHQVNKEVCFKEDHVCYQWLERKNKNY
jgi:hypothetical protein